MKAEKGSAAQATGRVSVPVPDGPTTPLIVDWQPEQRTDLEAAIRDGVVLVHLDERGLQILNGCKLAHGDYGYVGVVTKKEVIQLRSAQQVAANLPLTGGVLGAQIGGELSRGATLDIRLAIVGRHATTWTEVTHKDLTGGTCAGATHFIRALTVGAFTMKMNAEENARADVKVLGQGAGARHGQSSEVDTSDGKLEDCDRADPDAAQPPGQCRALVRIQLEPIAEGAQATVYADPQPAAAKPAQPPADSAPQCAPGLVYADGKCAEAVADKPHACNPDDRSDCQKQCEGGDATSCDRLAVLIQRSTATEDPATIDAALGKSCELGSATGCAHLGKRMLEGDGDVQRAMELVDRSCKQGEALGCLAQANAYWHATRGVKQDIGRALKLFERSCDGGYAPACTNASVLYSGATGVKRDDGKAMALSERACAGGIAVACLNVAEHYEIGRGTVVNYMLAASMNDLACRKAASTCIGLAILRQTGNGVPQDDAQAKDLFGRACRARGTQRLPACWVEQHIYGGAGGEAARPGEADHFDTVMRPQCDQGNSRACTLIGVVSLMTGKDAQGRADLARACKMKDPWACDLQKRMP